MKVLATGLEWFAERPGGLPRYFADYTEHLVRAGDELRALVGFSGMNKEVVAPSYVRGVRTNDAHTLAIRQLWRTEIANELKRDRYDVFNPHFAYYAWGAMNSPEMVEMPVVTHFQGPWAYESRVGKSGLKSSFRFALQKAIEQRVYRKSDRFIVLSDAFRHILTKDYGVPTDRIHVVPGAVDVHRFQPGTDKEKVRESLGLPTDRTIVVSVRRLVKRMGLENLIRATETLVKDFPELLLVIVGTGQLADELREMIQTRHLQQHVWMTGRVPDEDLPKYYQSADFSIVPSVSLEGFGLSTAESLACGTPVLGTPVGGTKEILSRFDKRLLLPGTEVPDLIEGIGNALSHQASLPSVEQCQQYVLQNHTWKSVIPKIRQVFVTAIQDRQQRQRESFISPALKGKGERI